MADSPQFFDHFVLSNMSLQERLGRSGAALNKDSAVFGQQVRSLLQMLTYGLDSVTARAASHLLNMDVLYSNDAYLLKLTEGLLLNSVQSITPPKIGASHPFRFWSERDYTRWSSVGTIGLKDGSKVNLIVYNIYATGRVEGQDKDDNEYEALYCAGNYVQQEINQGFDGYTPGVFSPIYVAETYKSIWSESVEVKLLMDGDDNPVLLEVAWSLDELLGMTNNDFAVLAQNTPRGLTITLGDGEIYGKGYNTNKAHITSVMVSYVKCDSLAPVDHSTIKFNKDVSPNFIKGEGIPLLTPLDMGDTASSLRSRSISEFFAASKITDERDLATEVLKIPFVKSVGVRREYNWSVWKTIRMLAQGYEYSRSTTSQLAPGVSNSTRDSYLQFYRRYRYTSGKKYNPGDMVVYQDGVWICSNLNYISGAPSARNGWTFFINLANGSAIGAMYEKYYPSACVYDNATIVMSGLVLKNRRYWTEDSHYSRGDVVYHSGTKQLWLAIQDGGEVVEPGSEDGDIYNSDGSALLRYWATREEAEILESTYGSNTATNPFANVAYRFDDYEQMTQMMFESEIKGYFNIAGKLGFTSVVVEPLAQIGVTVDCKYKAPYSMQQNIRKYIEDYVCYNVNKELRADDLNSQLTEKFSLSAVYVNIRFTGDATNTDLALQLPTATYVPPSLLEIEIKETL